MLALLKRDERSRVAGAARRRKIAPVDWARRICAVQDVSVREQGLECCGIAAVAPLAADVVAVVG